MKKKSSVRISMNILISVSVMVALFVFFTIYSGGLTLTKDNLLSLIDQSTLTMIAGCGTIFIVAQGSSDLSIGTTLAMGTILAGTVYNKTGNYYLLLPIVLGVSIGFGLLNGYLVAYRKIPSFMCTIAMLIGVRGLVNYIIDKCGVAYATEGVRMLNKYYIKIPVLVVCLILAWYVLDYTKFGRYSKAIGENEKVAISVGIPVRRMKMIAFILSAVMAGIAGIFMMAKLSGTNFTMGSFFEMQVVQVMFLGGVLVTGGDTASVSKVIVGALTLSIIENGLSLCGWTSTDIKQIVEGLLLMLVLFITIRFSDKVFEPGKKKAA